ncbi:hypothetical protein [Paenisporosarcina indica]|uniref:hypothetical protein n=1 Tax=Paenisporosarcina indica TaxID=650093 RepID=UPI00094FCE97|nr:hypothetical protein [Paenisporosarcina indica]
MDKKILILATRNTASISGEQRYIFQRASTLWKMYNIQTTIISLVHKNKKFKRKPQVPNGIISHVIFTDFFKIFLDIFSLFFKGVIFIKKNSVNFVILSGSPVLLFAPLLKIIFPKVILIWDVHGAIEEIQEGSGFSKKGKLKKLFFIL